MSDTDYLPASWAEVELGDVVDYGKTVKAEPTEIPDEAWLLELVDIEKDTSRLLGRVTFGERRSKSTKSRFAKGNVLYGKLRPYLNKVIRADRDGFCTTEIVPLKANDAVESSYLFYWLRHPRFLDYVTSVSHGLNMPRLGTDEGRRAPFVLAPINEQVRIAEKLDAVIARVEACRERLDRVPAILKRFREAVLEAAVSGRLTEDCQTEEADNPHWRQVTIADVAEVVRGASPRPAGDKRYFGGSIPWITVGELTKDEKKELTSVSTFVTEAGRDRSRYVEPGTLLLTNSGATLGVPKIIRIGGCINDGSVALLGLQEPLKGYVYYVLKGKTSALRRLNQGAAQPNLNISIVRAIEFAMPPSAVEQAEVVRRVDELFALADRLEAKYRAAVERVEKLTPAVLAKAFRGELVRQDPNDEPAEKLLEKIRAARASEDRSGSVGRGPGRRAGSLGGGAAVIRMAV